MGYESYFTLSHSSINGNENFAPVEVKFIKIWLTFFSRGISEPSREEILSISLHIVMNV